MSQHRNPSTTIDQKQTFSTVMSGGGVSVESNVEIMSEFKGPLIDKNGKLYIDEEYDETYKKRLRNQEILIIQQYIQNN